MNKINIEALDELYKAILSLETKDECAAFLEDICTIKELQDISQRLEVAVMLSKGANYQEVSRVTGASTATICRVNKCLLYGGGGYKNALTKSGLVEEKSE